MVNPASTDDTWIRRFHPTQTSGMRLACFPHAGGSASFYFPISAALHPEVEVLAVQYPGRQERRLEEPIRDLQELAGQAFDALLPWAREPLALFGHSMGALVAYEVARRLERIEDISPVILLVSGRRAPSTYRDEKVHLSDDAGLIAELKKLGGTNSAFYADEELWRMVLPALRGDYQAAETYKYQPGPALRCPITAIIGESDPRVNRAEAEAWSAHTTGKFTLEVFNGAHFYLTEHVADVLDLICQKLRSAT
jgi:surfactin synthase thioesterase subunit